MANNDNSEAEYFLGEFVSMDARMEDRLGNDTFHWFVIRRKNAHAVTVRGQFVRAEADGKTSVIVIDGKTVHIVAAFPREEVEGVFEDDNPVDIRKSA